MSKFCPFKNQTTVESRKCDKENCALWSDRYQCCGLISIHYDLKEIKDKIKK